MSVESKEKIVILDDSPSILNYLAESLKDLGYDVYPFKEPLSALNLLDKTRPDLILSDINMPNMNGYEFCNKITELPHLATVPLLFLSGESKPRNIVRGFQAGAVDYVTKPIILEVLLARLETHLNLARLRKEAEDKNNQLEALVAKKVKQITASQMGTITALAKLAEHRDEDTGSHLERVSAYCEIIARDLLKRNVIQGISENYICLLKDSSALHDIGKVAIPDHILLKPGRHTIEEFEIMKTHSKLGAETLRQVLETDPTNDFMKIGYEIALNHHEKWDGSGYPNGIAGENIPLSARIMAIADVYDALRSERCYKKGFSHSKAYAIIDEGKGSHFDPILVESFIREEKKFEAVWERFTKETQKSTEESVEIPSTIKT